MDNGTGFGSNPQPASEEQPRRPRLNLKPRDPARAAQLEAERQAHIKKNPFGDAKPREAIIASRVGKTEEEILKEEVKKEKLHLRLNPQQLEEKRAHEAAVKEIEDEISLEDDNSKREVLSTELAARQQKLDALMERFEKMALETALSGGAPRVSQMRREQSGPDALAAPPMAAAVGQAARYHPTQQYAGGRGGGRGYDYGAGQAPRTGYQPTRNYGGRGGGGGFEGGYEEQGGTGGGYRQGGGGGGYQQRGGRSGGFGSGGGYQPARGGGGYGDDGFGEGFDRQGAGGGGYSGGRSSSFRSGGGGGSGGGGYGDSSDQGFFDAPSLSAGGGGYGGGYGGGGGRSRGRGGRGGGGYRDSYGSQGGYGDFGGYNDSGFGGSQGLGGEIHFESQDRF